MFAIHGINKIQRTGKAFNAAAIGPVGACLGLAGAGGDTRIIGVLGDLEELAIRERWRQVSERRGDVRAAFGDLCNAKEWGI